MRHRPFLSGVVVFALFFCTLVSVRIEAQGSAKELIAEFASGDSTRCMNAGNATSTHQEHYQELAAELAPHLFDILENGPCSRNALTALVNVGDGLADGVDGDRAMRALVKVIEQALEEGASYDAISSAGSAVLVVGHFGAGGASAVPALKRWILERPVTSDRRYGLMALAAVGDASAPVVPDLLPLLAPPTEEDEEPWEKNELRTAIARALGSIPAALEESGPVLVAGLSDEDHGFRYAARESIAMIGAPIVPYLLPVLETTWVEPRSDVLQLLGGMGAEASDAVPAIAPLLADEEWDVSYEAGYALRRIGPTPDGIISIAKVLGQEDNEDAASTAAEILGEYGSAAKDALPALRQAAASKNWSIADAAKTAIAAIEGSE